ncbi:MAG: glycosyltransferase family 2 protein [Candidatus Omnitrophota bacterium]|nr:MAG: glycosyltransferase family 2 protein [Candidatus Omnitrophota bacterium]
MYKGKKIIVVMSSLNEEAKIANGVRRVPRDFVDEVVVVDDGSTDNTARQAELAGASVIRHKSNLGAGAGYRSGYFYGFEKGYDIIVELAGDDQDDPKEIPRLLDPIIDEGYDYVHGSRWLKGGVRINHPLYRIIATKFYSFLFRILIGFPSTDATNGFRAFRAQILKNKNIDLWQNWLNKYELEPYFFAKVVKNGYKIKEVPVTKEYHSEKKGYTKMIPIFSWWSILRPIILLRLGIKK